MSAIKPQALVKQISGTCKVNIKPSHLRSTDPFLGEVIQLSGTGLGTLIVAGQGTFDSAKILPAVEIFINKKVNSIKVSFFISLQAL